MRFHQLKKQKLPLWLAWVLPPWHSLQQKHLWNQNKKDQCQNSINFKHITKLLFFFFFCYFLTQSRNKNNGFAYMRPKIKYFQKIIILKKKKETENEKEKEKGTDRREKRRVWGQRVWERRVEAVCGTGGTVRTTLMNSLLRRRLMSAWYYRYYSHCCCYSDSLPLPLHWCFFCFCFALYFFKNQKNNQKKKKRSNFFVLRFWVKNKA